MDKRMEERIERTKLITKSLEYSRIDKEMWDEIYLHHPMSCFTIEEILQYSVDTFKVYIRDKNIDIVLND